VELHASSKGKSELIFEQALSLTLPNGNQYSQLVETEICFMVTKEIGDPSGECVKFLPSVDEIPVDGMLWDAGNPVNVTLGIWNAPAPTQYLVWIPVPHGDRYASPGGSLYCLV